MIQKEQNRMHRIYKFIQLFTDIPEVSSTVKRRKYLDPLLGVVKKTSENTYAYLFIRSFLRGSEYSGLLFRLIFGWWRATLLFTRILDCVGSCFIVCLFNRVPVDSHVHAI